MSKMAAHRDVPFLPEEIMRNILKRLPVKSLIRFQCVCKHWKNLFKTPFFVADHLHHSSVQNPSLLFKQNRGREPLHLRLIDCEMHVLEVQNPPLMGSLPDAMIVGSSNGLLCVASDQSKDSLFLWNPATREVRQIPATRTSKFPENDCTVGFGFSATVKDYKKGRIHKVGSGKGDPICTRPYLDRPFPDYKIVKTCALWDDGINRAEIYSLNTGSWKEIEFKSLEGLILLDDTFTANGGIFWHAEKRGVEEGEDAIDLIVSFDIAMELFTFIPLPPLPDHYPEITVYEDKLALLSLSRSGEYSYIDLWVLEEDIGSCTERWSWTKKYTSNRCPRMLHYPLTILRNEIVCGYDSFNPRLTNEGGQEIGNDEEKVSLYSINIITNERKIMYAILEYSHFGYVFNYVESLVAVGNIHFQEP